MIMTGIHFRMICQNLLLGLKNGKCFLIPVNVKSCILTNRMRKATYYMNSQQLEEVAQEKDLGILVSNDLKVSQQCHAACSKVMRILGIINRPIVFRHLDIML